MFLFNNNKTIYNLNYINIKLYNKVIFYFNNYKFFFKNLNKYFLKYTKYKIFFNSNIYKKFNNIIYTYSGTNNIFNTINIINKIYNKKLCLFKYRPIFRLIDNLLSKFKHNINYIAYSKKYLFYIFILNNAVKILYNSNNLISNYNLKFNYLLAHKNKNILNKIYNKQNVKFVYLYFTKIINKIILINLFKNINKLFISNILFITNKTYNINYYIYLHYTLYKFILNYYYKYKEPIINNIKYTKYKKNDLVLFINIFIKKLQTSRLNNNFIYTFYSLINKFIFGQHNIIKKLSSYLLNFNVPSKNKPLGSFLLCGPSGTGKTEIIKLITNYVYNSTKSLIHLDMSEYKEKHSISKLIGSPPGYIGHEEGGSLINKINLNPNSVVLFDEIEKANIEIFSIFLQILDEGILTDSKGISCKFNKSLIFFTSNLGSSIFNNLNKSEIFNIKYHNKVKFEINKYFKLEFINRLNDIIVFNPLLNIYLYSVLNKYIYSNYNINKLLLNNMFKSIISFASYSPQQGSRFFINNLNKIFNNINLLNTNKIIYFNNLIKYLILK